MERQASASALRTGWVAVGLLCAVCGAMPVAAQNSLPVVEAISRGTFFDSQVAVTVRAKGVTSTDVTHVDDASDVVVLRITIEPGGLAPWHTHSGTGFLVNMGPGTLTNVIGDDCVEQDYYPGHAFIDPGHGEFHAARNLSDEDVVLIATFVGVPGSPVTPAPGPHTCDFLE